MAGKNCRIVMGKQLIYKSIVRRFLLRGSRMTQTNEDSAQPVIVDSTEQRGTRDSKDIYFLRGRNGWLRSPGSI